jgi:hypothetical protein
MGKYLIFYKGVLAGRSVTNNGAKAKAWDMVKTKGWLMSDIEIREGVLS